MICQRDFSHSRLLGYLSNGQFTRYPPFRILDRPGLSWRSKGRKVRNKTLKIFFKNFNFSLRTWRALRLGESPSPCSSIPDAGKVAQAVQISKHSNQKAAKVSDIGNQPIISSVGAHGMRPPLFRHNYTGRTERVKATATSWDP